MQKKILLTGGTGFVGRNILESSLAEKYLIIAPKRAELDLLDDESSRNFFSRQKDFDVVIHSATRPGHRNANNSNGVFYDNCRIFFNLAKHSSNFGKFINIGSGSIYDLRNCQPKMSEDFFRQSIPSDEHGFFKYVAGNYMENASNMLDLRVFGLFGKYEDYSIRFISNAICKAIFDLPITIRQNRKFDYIHIDDLMPVLEFFIENKAGHKAYNVTPDSSTELLEIAQIVKKISQKNIEIKIAQSGLGLEYSGDNSRLKKEIKNFGFKNIESSIAELYQWYEGSRHLIDKQLLLTDK